MKITSPILVLLSALLILGSCGKKEAPAAVQPVFFDDFSAYPAANPWTPTGGWNPINASWPNNIQITSSKTLKFSGNGWALLTQNLNGEGYTISAKVKPYTDSGSKPDFCGIVSHFSSLGASDYFYALIYYPNTNSVSLVKFEAGSGSTLSSQALAASNVWHTFSLKINGNNITAFVDNGSQRANISHFEASPLSNGKIGLYFNWNNVTPDTEFDDFKVEA